MINQKNSKHNQQLLEQFISNCKNQNKSPHTLINYRSDIAKFLEWLVSIGDIKLKKVTPLHITAYLNTLQGQKDVTLPGKWPWSKVQKLSFEHVPQLGPASRRRHLTALKRFFLFLEQFNLCKFKHFPIKSMMHFIGVKQKDIEHTKLLAEQDWEKIQKLPLRAKDDFMLRLFYYGGLRLRELEALKWSDFNFASSTIRLQRKGGDIHWIKIADWAEISPLAIVLRRASADEASVFGLSARGISLRLKKILKRAQLAANLSPHSFRKACATRLYQKTKDLLWVRDYLNHSDAKVTQTYIELQ